MNVGRQSQTKAGGSHLKTGRKSVGRDDRKPMATLERGHGGIGLRDLKSEEAVEES